MEARAYRLEDGVLAPFATARGGQPLSLPEPFAVDIVPDQLAGWLQRRLDELGSARRAEAERADAEAERADAAEARAASLEEQLRRRDLER